MKDNYADIKSNVKPYPLVIHYGSNQFNIELINQIKNDNWVKPKGGLWTSPVNSEWGWENWCKSEQFRDCNEKISFKLKLNNDAKIYIIDCFDDLVSAPKITFNLGENYQKQYIDFEELAKEYDAIWLTIKGLNQTHLSYPLDFYGWDCETILIMNPKCCQII